MCVTGLINKEDMDQINRSIDEKRNERNKLWAENLIQKFSSLNSIKKNFSKKNSLEPSHGNKLGNFGLDYRYDS